MRIGRRQAGWLVALAVLGWLGWLMVRPEVLAVEVATASLGPLTESVGDRGETRARHRHVVTAPVAGRMDRLALEVGDTVRPGMRVARLEPLPLDARGRAQAEASLAAMRDLERAAVAAVEQARAAREQARADRVRGDRLLAGGGIAPAVAERLRLLERGRVEELQAAESRRQAARHDVEVARAALAGGNGGDGIDVTCPMGGVVLSLAEASARTVGAGELLLEVGDPASLEVVVDLVSGEAVRVSPGARLEVSGWGGDSVLAGRVSRIEPAAFTKVSALGVEEQRVRVVGTLDAIPVRLGHQFRVDVRVVLWEADSVLRIPASARFRRGDGWAVFVIEDGRARERSITIGHDSGLETEVTAGLAPGDLVIRHPTDRIRDQTRVRPSSP